MTNRVVLGARGGGIFGLFASYPGFDALTATDAQLMLSINQFTEQLIMLGATSSLPATIAFGYATPPFVFLTSTNLTITMVTATGGGNTYATSSLSGMFARPYPSCGNGAANVQAAVSAANMVISCPGGGTSVATYAVYRRTV